MASTQKLYCMNSCCERRRRGLFRRQVIMRDNRREVLAVVAAAAGLLLIVTAPMLMRYMKNAWSNSNSKVTASMIDECDWTKSVVAIPYSTIGHNGRASVNSTSTCKPFSLPLCGQAYGKYCTHLHSKECNCEKHPNCSAAAPQPWITLKDDKAMFSDWTNFTWKVHCNFSEIHRLTDYEYIQINHRTIHGDEKSTYYHLKHADVLNVSCLNSDTREIWFDILFVPMKIPRLQLTPTADQLRTFSAAKDRDLPMLNVLIWMTDAVSKNWFHRNMPKTTTYIKNSMGGIFMDGFTQVGWNSLPNMIPFWTGINHEAWLEPARHYWRFVEDLAPMFIEDYRKAGYVTAYYEESHASGSYDTVYNAPYLGNVSGNYRLNRFKNPAGDYFSYPFMVNRFRLTMESHPACFADKGSNWHAQNYLQQIWQLNEEHMKMFFFAQGSYSHHSITDLHMTDEGFEEFLQKWMNTPRVRNDTVIVFMSDHGLHLVPYALTDVESHLDTRAPLLYMVFPDWMDEKYPEQMQQLRENARQRLTTPYDLGVTLRHLLHGSVVIQRTNKESLGLSLFEPIPYDRTCLSAGVPQLYCSCLSAVPLPVKNILDIEMVQQLTEDSLPLINSYLAAMREFASKKTRENRDGSVHQHDCLVANQAAYSDSSALMDEEDMLEELIKGVEEQQESLFTMHSCSVNLSHVVKICKVEGWVPKQVEQADEGAEGYHQPFWGHQPQFLSLYFIADPGKVQVRIIYVLEDSADPEYRFQDRSFIFHVPPADMKEPEKNLSSVYLCMKAIRMYRRMTFA